MQVQVVGFEVVKQLYKDDPDFGCAWKKCSNGPNNYFLLQDGFLFKNNHLCIPQCSLREAIIKEAHGGGLAGHFVRDNFSSCAGEFHLAQDGTRYCATREAMSNLPPHKESQTEHRTIYPIACSKCPIILVLTLLWVYPEPK